jgi:hypothetical protein
VFCLSGFPRVSLLKALSIMLLRLFLLWLFALTLSMILNYNSYSQLKILFKLGQYHKSVYPCNKKGWYKISELEGKPKLASSCPLCPLYLHELPHFANTAAPLLRVPRRYIQNGVTHCLNWRSLHPSTTPRTCDPRSLLEIHMLRRKIGWLYLATAVQLQQNIQLLLVGPFRVDTAMLMIQ